MPGRTGSTTQFTWQPLPPNPTPQRSMLTDEALREEVAALQRQGHRRLLVLTGEHPKYTYDQFLQASATLFVCHQPFLG